MTTIQLTPAQHAILAYAIEHTGGKIEWFPDNIKGGARTKVLEGLFNKALITRTAPIGSSPPRATMPWGALGRRRPPFTPTPRSRPPCRPQRLTGRKKNRAQPRR